MIITYDEILIRKYKKEIDEYKRQQEKILEEFNDYQRTIDKLRTWIAELEENTSHYARKEVDRDTYYRPLVMALKEGYLKYEKEMEMERRRLQNEEDTSDEGTDGENSDLAVG